ncbi:tetratricopeptide repeat protein [Streptomyces sp. NRRL S-1868]|uniref:tetratricopeptide repeat protein n=1 Tax=Streptomyces sp. NRRL S-1868 TaxID=1463892 RepID=UPI0004C843D1|nr:hypothetical protein [Streptomyces sp. NRRL S-1868]
MPDHPYDLGPHSRPVATASVQAQRWFDRGLVWSYSFNHDEAVRCFEQAAAHDPDCSAAHWGAAYAKGPNYNKPWKTFDPVDLGDTLAYGRAALDRARATASSEPERGLAEALRARFPTGAPPQDPEDFRAFDLAYAEAMRPVHEAHPHDPDVAALFADALLCVSPRALWDLDTGEPTGYGTLEAERVLLEALARPEGARHPGLNHLYIHLMDMSAHPERAVPAAGRLRHLVPDASHMVHMATHIDAACGDYRRVVESNQAAAAADDAYFAREKTVGRYFVYRAHNLCYLAFGAMMSGRSQEALHAAHRLDALLTPEVLRVESPPMADLCESFHTVLPHVLIRFGRWEEAVALDVPRDQELYCSTTAMVHYAHGIAHAALGRTAEADAAREEFTAAAARVPETRLNATPSREVDVLRVAGAMLDGEIAYRKGEYDRAFADLRRAIAFEDALPYTDPVAWLQPVRHAYAALLHEQGRTEEAAAVHRADLGLDDTLARWRTHPGNVWSLHGLHTCLTQLGRHEEARALAFQRDIAVAGADVPVAASCYCALTAFEDSPPESASGCCSPAPEPTGTTF